ncbi:hypothetical protein [Streptomyces sp. NPDC000410]|uniref:hypothetical protein n=1 Tax=Streptomyces sp. NPDC000410 TaxID=3154254 RepID=UPI00332F8EDA
MSATTLVRLKRVALTTSLCTATALGLAACLPTGQDDARPRPTNTGPYADLSGSDVLNKAVTATKKATSLKIDLEMQTADGKVAAYMAVDTKGDCAGTMSIGPTGTMEIVRTGDKVYVRSDEAAIRQEVEGESKEVVDAVLEKMLGKWVESDMKDPDAATMAEFCDLDTLLSDVEANDNMAKKAGESKVDGVPTLAVTESDSGVKYTMHVATKGVPYLVKTQAVGGKEPFTMKFSDFNKPVPARKPPAKDTVKLDDL